MSNVTIQIQSDAVGNPMIPDVVVEFYDTSGVFQTSGTTDVDGEVLVSLPDADYDVVCFLIGLSILPRQPQRITVSGASVFLVTGHLRTLPESTDPKKTKVSGYVLGGTGRGTKTHLSVSPKKTLLDLGDNQVVLPESRKNFHSDDDGYFEFELLRGKSYTAYFRDMEELFGQTPPCIDLIVPDQPSVRFNDLFFPVQVDVDFSANTLSVSVDSDFDDSISATITFSDGSTNNTGRRSVPWSGLTVSTSDGNVAEGSIEDGKLVVRPISAGTTVITVTRYFIDAVEWDDPPTFTSESVTVTVS